MKAAAPKTPAGQLWQPPLPAIAHPRGHELVSAERAAITSYFEYRSEPGRRSGLCDLPEGHPLERVLRPVRDALDLIGGRRSDRNAAMAVLLRECLAAGTTFWSWSHDHWLDVLGRHSRAFRARNQGRASQSVRIEIAAVAYLRGWFRDILALGHFKRDSLARRVFGAEVVGAAARRVLEPLKQWGYRTGTAHLSCLAEALLLNESPHLEHLTAERLDRFRRDTVVGKRSLYFQLAKALAAGGILAAPLHVAHPLQDGTVPRIAAEGVGAAWNEWIERWRRTSTLESRNNLRLHLYKLGRWLAVHHPDVDSPGQWTRDLCAEYVAAACHMGIGDYTVRKTNLPRAGQRLAPRAMAAEIVAARTFFWDCQEWGWIPRRFDPGRSLAVPRSVKAQIARKPRVIADDIWARLLWAGLHLEKKDLPRSGRDGVQGHAYPLEYARALALVWLFAGLRSDEIGRLRVGCVRWQQPAPDAAARPVCLLDVPVHKTGVDFTKPVEPQVGQAIEAWEAVRPKQPQHVDRKTGERVDPLFMHRARPMRREIINESIIPTLCRKADVPTQDVRGRITSHRARATIASQLFNSREPMSLFELQAWLGHGSPASTQHYVAITPTKLAKAYADAGYFERNIRAIEVLIDQDTIKQAAAAGEPWRFYDLGHGLCAYEFFDQCAHRMACARCDFYRPRQSSLVQLLEAKTNILRLLQEIPLTDDERAVVDGDLSAIDRLTISLADRPTPSGQTPAALRRCAATTCSGRLTCDST